MRILITGVAGFMGSWLAEYFMQKDSEEVFGIDDESGGSFENVRHLAQPELGTTCSERRMGYYKFDLGDTSKTENCIETVRPEVIFHMAAWAHEGMSQFCPVRITRNNYTAYLNVLTSAIRHGVKKVICVSSMSVYGDQEPPFNEDMPRKPADIYAVSKTAMEEATEILCPLYGINYTILRPHNVVGERQNMADPYRNVAAIFINRMLGDKPFYIYGDGEQRRSFSYIGDINPCIASVAYADHTNGRIINVGPAEETTINHLASLVLKEFGKEDDGHYKPIYLPPRPKEVKHAWCTCDRAIELLGFEPKTSLDAAIHRMVEWARKEGYREPKYLESLELENEHTPRTWREKLI